MGPTAPSIRTGEIVESSTTGFTARAPLHAPPALGALVRTGGAPSALAGDPFAEPTPPEGAAYGIVLGACTASLDSGRRPHAFGLSEDELRREQPQVFELLATDFRAALVACVEGGSIRHRLPSHPPRLHALVEACEPWEIRSVCQRTDFLHGLLRRGDCDAPEEVLAAFLRQAAECQPDPAAFAVRAGKELAVLLADDAPRLLEILAKLGPLPVRT